MAPEEAFEELYAAWFDRIHAWVRARASDRTRAEDVTQEIFIAIYRSLGSFEGRSDFDAWVFGVARNVLRSHRREERRRAEGETAVRMEAPPTPEDHLRASRLLDALVAGLREVGATQAELFRAHYIDDVPLRELARRSGRSPHSLRSSLYRIRGRLVRGGRR
jgi:RNA polymerase sigma-70 factor (ECF subfamily)